MEHTPSCCNMDYLVGTYPKRISKTTLTALEYSFYDFLPFGQNYVMSTSITDLKNIWLISYSVFLLPSNGVIKLYLLFLLLRNFFISSKRNFYCISFHLTLLWPSLCSSGPLLSHGPELGQSSFFKNLSRCYYHFIHPSYLPLIYKNWTFLRGNHSLLAPEQGGTGDLSLTHPTVN